MTVPDVLGLVWVLAALLMIAGWLWQWRHQNAGIVDVLWAAGLAMSAVLCATLGTGALPPRLLLALSGALWGARLAWHLWGRVRWEGEDGRYRYLRSHWQGSQLKWFAFFQLQAGLVVLFSVPFVIAAANRATRPGWLAVAVAIWCVSVGGESLSDTQLARFRADPANRGRTCERGLWRYSRHPNYFFEWLHWFTYVALAVGAASGWVALIGPLIMLALLRFLSGIPFTEAQALRTRGENYRAYQERTSMLFPWPPRR